MSSKFNRDAVKTAVLIFGFVHVTLFALYFATAVWDTQWNKLVSTGMISYNSYSFVYWILFVYFVMNIILFILLFVFLADSRNKPVIDIHFIWSWITLFFNMVMIVLFLIYYLFVNNTNFSAYLPFNDPFYCCYYWSSNPTQCYNTAPCTGYTNPLKSNNEFVLHWISTGVFFGFAVLHLIANRMLRNSGVVSRQIPKKASWRKWGVFVSYIYMGLFTYWAAWPLWDTIFIFGFPLLGIPPGPGPFYSNRYGYQWWFLFFMIGNLLPPLFFFVAANNKRSVIMGWLYLAIILLVAITNFVSLCVFVGVWLFDCNNQFWFNSEGSICNSYQYCCSQFGGASNTCPNTTPCPYSITLYANHEFIQHMIFGLVFLIASTIVLWMWYRLTYNKVIAK